MHSSGSALQHIHLVDFKSAPIPIPPIDHQLSLVDRIRRTEKALDTCEHHINATQRMRVELMKHLITAEITHV